MPDSSMQFLKASSSSIYNLGCYWGVKNILAGLNYIQSGINLHWIPTFNIFKYHSYSFYPYFQSLNNTIYYLYIYQYWMPLPTVFIKSNPPTIPHHNYHNTLVKPCPGSNNLVIFSLLVYPLLFDVTIN